MSEHEKLPEDVAYQEFEFDGVTHRVPVTPEQARRWLEGKKAIGMGRGEPMVDRDGRLVEHHGLPADPDAEPVEPDVLGVPLDPEDWEAFGQATTIPTSSRRGRPLAPSRAVRNPGWT